MHNDAYSNIAERYDRMRTENPEREKFFRELFSENNVSSVLDCACGTGSDLLMFNSLGFKPTGSDLSESMLEQAKIKLADNKLEIPLVRADFRELGKHFDGKFDAVVCLNNSINEVHDDDEAVKAISSMREVLRDGGILVLDQGQTNSMMRNPPSFAPIINDRDLTRVFVMEYSKDMMKVNVLDFIHTETQTELIQSTHEVKIRLRDEWVQLMLHGGFRQFTLYGGWDFDRYGKNRSRRLIVIAEK